MNEHDQRFDAAAALMAGCGSTSQPAASNKQGGETRSSAPAPIVGRIITHAALKEPFPTVAKMATATSVVAVIQGHISSVTWEDQGSLAKTAYRVSVEHTLKGSAPKEVLVREDGGYLSAADVQRANVDKFSGSDAPATGFVDVSFEGASHPRVGDNVVLFLEPDPNPGREDSYVLAGSSFDRFVLQGSRYTRAAVQEGWESGLTLTSVRSALTS